MMNENLGVRSVANWRARMAGCFFKKHTTVGDFNWI